jgi:biotin transport system substrate-specific component
MATQTHANVSAISSAHDLSKQALKVLFGTLVLAIASWISIPMVPVPFTLQTYAVIVMGALLGWRMGSLTVLAWLGEAMVGMPVLAHGASGLSVFAGTNAGYLFSFPVIAAFVGLLVERGMGKGIVRLFSTMLAANVINLALGATWLAVLIGWNRAMTFGVRPFLGVGLLYASFATLTVWTAQRSRRVGADAQ